MERSKFPSLGQVTTKSVEYPYKITMVTTVSAEVPYHSDCSITICGNV